MCTCFFKPCRNILYFCVVRLMPFFFYGFWISRFLQRHINNSFRGNLHASTCPVGILSKIPVLTAVRFSLALRALIRCWDKQGVPAAAAAAGDASGSGSHQGNMCLHRLGPSASLSF